MKSKLMACFRPSHNSIRLKGKSESWKQTMPLRQRVFRHLKTKLKHLDCCQGHKTLLPIRMIPSVLITEWTNHWNYQTHRCLLMKRTQHEKCERQRFRTSWKSTLTTTQRLYPRLPTSWVMLKATLQSISMPDAVMRLLSCTLQLMNSLNTLPASTKIKMSNWLREMHTRTSEWESLSHL